MRPLRLLMASGVPLPLSSDGLLPQCLSATPLLIKTLVLGFKALNST